MPQKYFLDRIGRTVIRDGREFFIKDKKYALYLYSLGPTFEYTDPKPFCTFCNELWTNDQIAKYLVI